jgi:CelD/BcsL family acetyltransferase involved in cellulose biosynthesis
MTIPSLNRPEPDVSPLSRLRFHNEQDLSVEPVTTDEAFDTLEESWNSLLSCSAANDFFLRWEWLRTWWKVFKEDRFRLCILLVKRGDEPVGIAPFYIKRERCFGLFTMRTLMLLGSGEEEEEEIYSEYLDVISLRGEEEPVVEAALGFILDCDWCDSVRLSNIRKDSATVEILHRFCADRGLTPDGRFQVECPYARLPDTYGAYLNGLSSSMRYEIRSDTRKLAKLGEVRIRKTESPDEIETDFSELSRLHGIRMGSKGAAGAFAYSQFASFHRAVIPVLLKNGHLDLWFLSVSSKNVAVCYNIRYNRKVYFYQTGFDGVSVGKISAGLVLTGHCVEQAIASKMTEYDFMGGGGMRSYKGRWSKDHRLIGEMVIPIGRLAGAYSILRTQLASLKRRLFDP